MKIKNLVELLSTLDPEATIRSHEKWDAEEDACVMDIVDVMVEKHMKTQLTHVYLVLGCEECQQEMPRSKNVAVPPRPYRASD
ncbi:hypothetical protein [Synechococcus phage DSL-LC03]|nr:hypothetical protein [Synechococcus phage DSL-LC03]